MDWVDEKQKWQWGRIATLCKQWENSCTAVLECTRVAAEALQLVEQDGNDGRRDPDAQQDLEDAQDDLKMVRAKLQKKSKYLIDFVNARNGEMAGDGTRAVKRLMSRQFQESFNLSVASLAEVAPPVTAAAAAAVTAVIDDAAAAATDAPDVAFRLPRP